MDSITVKVTPDLLPVLLQHQHSFAGIIPFIIPHYSPSDPSPLLNPPFLLSYKPFSSLYSVILLQASPSLILLWRAREHHPNPLFPILELVDPSKNKTLHSQTFR